jgi:hypothetical protein
MDWEETQIFEKKLSVSDDLQQQVDFLKTKLTAAVDNIAILNPNAELPQVPNAAVQHTIDSVFNQPLSISQFISLAWQSVGVKIAVGVFVLILAGGGAYFYQNHETTQDAPNILEIFEYHGLNEDKYQADIDKKDNKTALAYIQENHPNWKGDIMVLNLLLNPKTLPSELEFLQAMSDIEKSDKYTNAEEILVIKIGYYQLKNRVQAKEYCKKLLEMPDINLKYKAEAEAELKRP